MIISLTGVSETSHTYHTPFTNCTMKLIKVACQQCLNYIYNLCRLLGVLQRSLSMKTTLKNAKDVRNLNIWEKESHTVNLLQRQRKKKLFSFENSELRVGVGGSRS